MVLRYLLVVIVAITFPASSFARDEGIFAEIREVYIAVFSETVRDHEHCDRVISVAMDIRGDGDLIPMPDDVWERLKSVLEARQIDVSTYVSADRIEWMKEESKFIDRLSRKDAWVYTISGITWHGTDCLHVYEYMTHGNLAGGGSTMVLRKKDGRWSIVDRKDHWIAESNGRRAELPFHAIANGRKMSDRP